jgi:CRP-like cAMP-binding protein
MSMLKGVPLFSGLSDDDLKTVAARMKEVHFDAGREVATQGETGVGFHLIVEGNADVSKDGESLPPLGPGGYFGEIGLIDGGPRSATVTATSDLTTLSLVAWDFTPLLENAGFTRALLLGLCEIARRHRGG